MGLDLIVAADSRSGGQDGLAARAAAKLAGILLPRRRVGKNSPEFTNPGAPGSNRPELGSGMVSTLWVVHLDAQLSSAELWTTRVRAAAGLRSGARRRARSCASRAQV